MKLFKKLLALTLVLCMVFCLSVAVLAADGDGTGDGSSSSGTYNYVGEDNIVKIKKNYSVVGEGVAPAETFKLYQAGASQTDGETMTDIPALVVKKDTNNTGMTVTVNSSTYNVVGTATFEANTVNNSTGVTKEIEIEIPAANSYNVGVYEYTLKEYAGDTAGVTYYSKDIALIITVVEDNGQKRVAAVHTEDKNSETGKFDHTSGEGKKDTFNNTYSAGKLSLTKKVTGNYGDRDKYFKFTVKLDKDTLDGKTFADSFTSTQGSYDANKDNTKDNPSSVDFTEKVFYLKDNETITISNIPAGVKYTITEEDYSGEKGGYTTTNTIDTNASQDGKTATSTIEAEANKNIVAFTNNRVGTPDTGVSLDSLPYILALAVAFGGAVVMITRKRHVED